MSLLPMPKQGPFEAPEAHPGHGGVSSPLLGRFRLPMGKPMMNDYHPPPPGWNPRAQPNMDPHRNLNFTHRMGGDPNRLGNEGSQRFGNPMPTAGGPFGGMAKGGGMPQLPQMNPGMQQNGVGPRFQKPWMMNPNANPMNRMSR